MRTASSGSASEIDAAYAKAEPILDTALTMYPDAAELAQLRDEVATRKQRYLSELAEQYEGYLAAGRLLSSKEHSGIQGVMQRIRLVEPRHPLLVDPRLAGAFAAAAAAFPVESAEPVEPVEPAAPSSIVPSTSPIFTSAPD